MSTPRRILALAFALAIAAAGPARAQFADPRVWSTNGPVTAVRLDGNTLYFGGSFTTLVPVTGHFAVFDLPDRTWSPNWPRVDGEIFTVQPDGEGGCFIGGRFHHVGGLPRANVAHLQADGTLSGWNPGADFWVQDFALSGTTLYMVGPFDSVGGEPRDEAAAVDATTGALLPWSPGAIDGVHEIDVENGVAFLGGDFLTVAGQYRPRLASVDATTGALTGWNPNAWDTVNELDAVGDVVYVAGRFSHVGGQARRGVGAVSATTSLATGWNPVLENVTPFAAVETFAIRNGTMYLTGNFNSVGGQPRLNHAAVDLVTGAPTAWHPPIGAVNQWSVVALDDAVYVGGSFAYASGGTTWRNVVATDPGTGAILPWNPSPDDIVYALGSDGSRLFLGGYFRGMFPVSRRNLAAIDVTTGAPTPWDPRPNGAIHALRAQSTLVYVAGAYDSIAGVARSRLSAIYPPTGAPVGWWVPPLDNVARTLDFVGGRLFVGGDFTAAGGGYGSGRLVAFDPAPGPYVDWEPLADAAVRSLSGGPQGLFAGGSFSQMTGQPRGRGAAFASNGTLTAWDPAANAVIEALLATPTRIYVGGAFTSVGGQSRAHLAALDPVSALATSWQPAISGGNVYAIDAGPGVVYAAGDFYQVGSEFRSGLVALDSTTAALTAWNARSNGPVTSLHVVDGVVYAGGSFIDIGGQGRRGLVRLLPQDEVAPIVDVTVPDDTLIVGDSVAFTWSASDDFSVAAIDLYVSRSGPTGPWQLIAGSAPNGGAYTWTVTGPIAAGTCHVRIDARDPQGNVGSEVTPAFSILESWVDVPPSGDARLALLSPRPHPLARTGHVSFQLPHAGRARLSVLDVAGREVAVPADGVFEAGSHQIRLDASRLAPGVYFVRLQALGATLHRRMAVLQ